MPAGNCQMDHFMKESVSKQPGNGLVSNLPNVVSLTNKAGPDKFQIPHKAAAFDAADDASLFSSSLPLLPHPKLNLSDCKPFYRSVDDDALPKIKMGCDDGVKDAFVDIDRDVIGCMLPDDEEDLLSGIMDDFDMRGLPNQLDDLDESDLFGLDLDFDPQDTLIAAGMSKLNLADGVGHYGISNGVGTIAGEHPYGEHPSRTLFVRNINSNVEDSELRTLFEQFGDIRALYTACKHRGFVMISYYDIRAARAAMRALQNKPLRRRKLDIHFSIPKDNPSEKDINQGTLVVFNLDSSVTNDDLRYIFGAYGEVKEIRETPHKRHHKFIEFYDVRAAEAALRALNRSDIAGKRIKLEPSRPGGARRNSLIQQMSHEVEQEEVRAYQSHIGSPVGGSPPGSWPLFDSPVEHSPLRGSPVNGNCMTGLASILPRKISPIGKDQGCDGNFLHGKLAHSPSNGICTLTGPQFLWGSPSSSSSSPVPHVIPAMMNPTHRHHVGSVPIGRHSGYFPDTPEPSFMSPSLFGGHMGLLQNGGTYMMNMRPILVPPRAVPSFLRTYQNAVDGTVWRDNSSGGGNQIDVNKQYYLDPSRIISGEDARTTLMIKNIPNKYTSKMLLATIDEQHGGTYDFLYLPIDFKNKCNVGYAFINMASPACIIPFYEAFNGKKWEKFNSEKVASLAYARIQGKVALVNHFQNSSLMNEDKRCRPIVFPSEDEIPTI